MSAALERNWRARCWKILRPSLSEKQFPGPRKNLHGEVQDQIDDTVKDGLSHARSRLPSGESETHCIACGDEIPEKRRQALPGVKTCVQCQAARDKMPANQGFNRRGSKDSQLR